MLLQSTWLLKEHYGPVIDHIIRVIHRNTQAVNGCE